MTTISTTAVTANPGQPQKHRASFRRIIDIVLLAFMLVNLVWAMNTAEWSSGLDRLFPVVVIAIVAGASISLSGFNHLFTLLYALIVGVAAILFSMSVLAPEGLVAQERAYHVLNRAITWTISAVNGQPVADNFVFILLLAMLMWVLSFAAMWSYLRDRNKWQAVIPAGLAMLVVLYYAPPQLNTYFVIYLLCAILLLVRATLTEKEIEWYYARVQFPFDISFDFMRDGILFAVFVIFVSWVLPGAAGEGQLNPLLAPLQQPWREFQQEWTRLFSTINYGRTTGTPAFGTSLSLGGPRNVTDDIVMDVETPVDRYYRAVIMDTYLQGGWVMQNTTGVRLTDSEQYRQPTWRDRREITQTVTLYQPSNVLISAPQPLRAILPFDARVIPAMTQDELAAAPDITSSEPIEAEFAMLVSRDMINIGESYVVVGSIVEASETALRADSTLYPDHIEERYLQLPETVPQRVLDLADELATDVDNPYDTAKKVEQFLRGYEYNDQIPGPAPGQDGVDYFLFEEQQGYCNYYASSMAVILRYLGIPARLAVGYATGEHIPETEVFRLRNYDSHTWVEVYFPTYGWVEFEPTASEPVLFRPTGEIETQDDDNTLNEARNPFDNAEDGNIPIDEENFGNSDFSGQQTPAGWLEENAGSLLLFGSILGIALVALWTARRIQKPPTPKRPVFRTVPPGFSVRLWRKLMTWARRLGLAQDPSKTPFEQAALFANAVPEAASDIDYIVDIYARDLYSPYELSTDDASNAQLSWLTLRPLLWKHWIRLQLHLPEGLRRSLFARKHEDEPLG